MDALIADQGKSLKTVLLHLGNGILNALMSRSGLGLYKVAVSESNRFGAAAAAYWECGPQRAIETVCKGLQAQTRGEIAIEDPSIAALQFVGMLRGDLHLEILFGFRCGPGATEIHARVKSVVDVFLNGVLASADVERNDMYRAIGL